MDKKMRTRKVFYILFAIGSLGILNTLLLMLFNSGINVGSVLPGILGIMLIAAGYIIRSGKIEVDPMRHRRLYLAVAILFIIGLFSFILVEGLIVINSGTDETIQADYLIVLGAGLKGDQVSQTLLERMKKSVEFLTAHPDVPVVVSGGQGFGEAITEAEAMKRYLISHGITLDRIIIEDKSTSTMENFKFTKQKLPEKNEKIKLAVITNRFHMFRAKFLARRNGFEVYAVPCKTPVSVFLNCYLREYFAVIKSFFLDRN